METIPKFARCLTVDRVAINNSAIQPKSFDGNNALSVASSTMLEAVCLVKHLWKVISVSINGLSLFYNTHTQMIILFSLS